MALTKGQNNTVLKMFVRTFANVEDDEKMNVYTDFCNSFLHEIDPWENLILNAFADAGYGDDVIEKWKVLEKERKENRSLFDICKMTTADEEQIIQLMSVELHRGPYLSTIASMSPIQTGTVKDFEESGYSFVAKRNTEVVGAIMAQRVIEYGFNYIYVSMFAVKSTFQGFGIGSQLMNQVIECAKKEQIHTIRLFTDKSIEAYKIYHHMGFRDPEDPDGVHLTKWF